MTTPEGSNETTGIMAKLEIIPFNVNIDEIALMDTTITGYNHVGVHLKSPYYTCTFFVSANLLQLLIKWLLQNHFIELQGTLTIPIGTRKEVYLGTAEETNSKT